ncbi:hypothetical protein OIU85_028931 [Salix viminalis]|uniref:Uncharacterized protein n=1 Tax=Salix viminalis TaxID=40686 RepID=A0A9Q0QAH5_SALVM|nr:hypothetical protein OIU85_028931 [Salix viminalis]
MEDDIPSGEDRRDRQPDNQLNGEKVSEACPNDGDGVPPKSGTNGETSMEDSDMSYWNKAFLAVFVPERKKIEGVLVWSRLSVLYSAKQRNLASKRILL